MKRTLILFFLIAAAVSCNKIEYTYEYVYDKPVMGNFDVSAITSQSAILTGTISKDGGKHIQERGFILSETSFTTSIPSKAKRIKAADSPGLGVFSTELTGLSSGKTYYACAYGKSEEGEVLSAVKSFKTEVDPEVILDNTDLDYFVYYVTSSTAGFYKIWINIDVKFVRVDQIESAGVKVNDATYDLTELPADDTKTARYTPDVYSDDGEFSISVSAFARTKDGVLLETEARSISFSAMGVRIHPILYANNCRWYSEPDKGYYSHQFFATLHTDAGAGNIARLGYYPNTTYSTYWFGSLNSYTYEDGGGYGTYFSEVGNSPSKSMSVYAEAILKNGISVDFCDYITGANDKTSTYGTTTSYDVFFSENFDSGVGKFSNIYSISESNYVWEYNSSSKYLFANSYSNGSAHAADTWVVSDEIDLTNRSSVELYFRASARYFTDIPSEFGIMINRASTGTWTVLDVSKITNKTYWDDYTFSLADFEGDKIKIAFTYKGTDEACGSIYLDDIEVYSIVAI